jgi:hypothetical protein
MGGSKHFFWSNIRILHGIGIILKKKFSPKVEKWKKFHWDENWAIFGALIALKVALKVVLGKNILESGPTRQGQTFIQESKKIGDMRFFNFILDGRSGSVHQKSES